MSGGLINWLNNLRWVAGSADFSDPGIGGASNTGWVPGFVVLFNRQGSFFNGPGQVGFLSNYNSVLTIRNDSDRARAFMLLHEISHVLSPNGFQNGDGADDNLQRSNNDLIWEHCNKSFMSFGNTSGH
jgi:hypothetical protein